MNRDDIAALDLNAGGAIESIQRDLSKAISATAQAAHTLSTRLEALRGLAANQRKLLASLTAQLATNRRTAVGEPRFVESSLALLDDWTSLAQLVTHTGADMAEHLLRLAGHVETMQETTSAVDRLARESRFIAFNARIQIQRARSSGDTFKVIAEEVKRLAGETAQLSLHINQSVADSRQEIESLGLIKGQLLTIDTTTATQTRDRLLALVEQLAGWHGAFDETMAQVTNFIADAVRAAQFDDIVTQILEGASRKIGALQPLILRSLRAAALPYGFARDDEVQSVVLALSKLAKTETLRQTSLEHNDIELF